MKIIHEILIILMTIFNNPNSSVSAPPPQIINFTHLRWCISYNINIGVNNILETFLEITNIAKDMKKPRIFLIWSFLSGLRISNKIPLVEYIFWRNNLTTKMYISKSNSITCNQWECLLS